MARGLGATHGINTSLVDVVAEVRKVTGAGTTITIDATGVVSLILQGIEMTANQGRIILLGVAPMDAGLNLPIVPYMVVCIQLQANRATSDMINNF